jgi:mono/diheme cytochrome c family protein
MITAVIQTIIDVFHQQGRRGLSYWRGGSLIRLLLLGIAFLCIAPGQVPAQDAGAGEKVFVQCRTCHQVGETAKNGIGPHLNGVFGRQAGSVEGYAYTNGPDH